MRKDDRSAVVAAALALVAFAACGGEVDPERIAARSVAAGRFEVAEGGLQLVDAGTRRSCAHRTSSSVSTTASKSRGGATGTLPISFWWVHPEFAIPSKKLWGTETSARPGNPELARGEAWIDGRALWTLDDPEERVSGEYRFEIRRSADGRPILVVPFTIEGC